MSKYRDINRRRVNLRYGLFYKGECQGKYFSLDRKREPFLDFQPLSRYVRRSVLRSCHVVVGRCSISEGSSSISSDDADRFLKLASAVVCMGVSTMDLSEARGLVLFRVIREGIGISQRLSATGTRPPTGH